MNNIQKSIFLFLSIAIFSLKVSAQTSSENSFTHSSIIIDIDLFTKSQKLFTVDKQGNGKLWDLKNNTVIKDIPSIDQTQRVKISSDFHYYYTISSNGLVKKIKTSDDKLTKSKQTKIDFNNVDGIELSPDGKWIYVLTFFGNKLVRISTDDLSYSTRSAPRGYNYIKAFSPVNGCYLAEDKNEYRASIIDYETQKEIFQKSFDGLLNTPPYFSPDGKYVGIRPGYSFFSFYDVKTGDFLFEMNCIRGDSLNDSNQIEMTRALSRKNSKGQVKFGKCLNSQQEFFDTQSKFFYEFTILGHLYKWNIASGKLVQSFKSNKKQKEAMEKIIFRVADTNNNSFYGGDSNGKLYKYDFINRNITEIGVSPIGIISASYSRRNSNSFSIFTNDDKGTIININTQNNHYSEEKNPFPNSSYLQYPLAKENRYSLVLNDNRAIYDSKLSKNYQLPPPRVFGGSAYGGRRGAFSKDEKYFALMTEKGLAYAKLNEIENLIIIEKENRLGISHWTFSKNEDAIIYATYENEKPVLKTYNLSTKKIDIMWKGNENHYLNYFAFSPNKNLLSLSLSKSQRDVKATTTVVDANSYKEVYVWENSSAYNVDWLNDSTLISTHYDQFAVLDLNKENIIKSEIRGEHYASEDTFNKSVFSSKGNFYAGISLRTGNPLQVFDNEKKEFWQLNDPSFQNVNTIDMNENGKELLIVYGEKKVARIDLIGRKVISRHQYVRSKGTLVQIQD